MQAQALICTAQQQFSLEQFDVPDPTSTQIRVQTLYSGVSVGTEFSVIRGKLDWGPFPVCTGYQAVGVVEAVGPRSPGLRQVTKSTIGATLCQ
ncbi:MAG: hypothetical protein R2932_54235 [Caldilineaceae bacterium]